MTTYFYIQGGHYGWKSGSLICLEKYSLTKNVDPGFQGQHFVV